MCEGAEPQASVLIRIDGMKHPVSDKALVAVATAQKGSLPSPEKYAVQPNDPNYEFSPYWLVRGTPDLAAANLESSTIVIAIAAKVKRSHDDLDVAIVTIPILTNTKTIQPGTELLAFKALKRQCDTETPSSVPKAQKIGKGKGTSKGRGKGNGGKR